jgi:hypothetical protein
VSLLNSYLKWAFWAARPVLKKKSIMNYELLFSWAKIRTESNIEKKLGSILLGLKIVFLGLAVFVILVIIVKGVCLLLLPLVSLG